MSGGNQPTLQAGSEQVLRPWLARDADDVLKAFQVPDIQRWHMRVMGSREEATAWVHRWAERWEAETDTGWAVTSSSAGAVLGQVSLRDINLEFGHAECTYWVLPMARGRGVASSSAGVVARWALDDLGLHRVQVMHSVANRASCRVALNAGFSVEGTMRSALLHHDGWHDMHLHAMLQPDA
jgi:RimJ/RimL family protein N-acetyltransferase